MAQKSSLLVTLPLSETLNLINVTVYPLTNTGYNAFKDYNCYKLFEMYSFVLTEYNCSCMIIT